LFKGLRNHLLINDLSIRPKKISINYCYGAALCINSRV